MIFNETAAIFQGSHAITLRKGFLLIPYPMKRDSRDAANGEHSDL